MDTKELLIELIKWDYLNDPSELRRKGHSEHYAKKVNDAMKVIRDHMVSEIIIEDEYKAS